MRSNNGGKNMNWYSVVVIRKGSFASQIMDERHFGSYLAAYVFKITFLRNRNLKAVIMNM